MHTHTHTWQVLRGVEDQIREQREMYIQKDQQAQVRALLPGCMHHADERLCLLLWTKDIGTESEHLRVECLQLCSTGLVTDRNSEEKLAR